MNTSMTSTFFFRQVFTNSEMKEEFRKFFQTILYSLDENKVFRAVEEILQKDST